MGKFELIDVDVVSIEEIPKGVASIKEVFVFDAPKTFRTFKRVFIAIKKQGDRIYCLDKRGNSHYIYDKDEKNIQILSTSYNAIKFYMNLIGLK